jgi:hypothetical protein
MMNRMTVTFVVVAIAWMVFYVHLMESLGYFTFIHRLTSARAVSYVLAKMSGLQA